MKAGDVIRYRSKDVVFPVGYGTVKEVHKDAFSVVSQFGERLKVDRKDVLGEACVALETLKVDWDILVDVFGEQYWNDTENIICVPCDRISPDELSHLKDHDVYAENYAYLVGEL